MGSLFNASVKNETEKRNNPRKGMDLRDVKAKILNLVYLFLNVLPTK